MSFTHDGISNNISQPSGINNCTEKRIVPQHFTQTKMKKTSSAASVKQTL